jgi:hypothetical protein
MDAKVGWFRVVCTCVAGGGLWLCEGQVLRAEELGDHLPALIERGAIVPLTERRTVNRPAMAKTPKARPFSLR